MFVDPCMNEWSSQDAYERAKAAPDAPPLDSPPMDAGPQPSSIPTWLPLLGLAVLLWLLWRR